MRVIHLTTVAVSTLAGICWASQLYACVQNPGKPTIKVSGAQAGTTQNYYVVKIPDTGTATVTITGSGDTPCPTDQEKCVCQDQKKDPEEEGKPKYTFSVGAGTQDPADGPIVKWEVNSSTTPQEYKFKVVKIEQNYKACPQGWTGGVTSKSNSQVSDEVTVLACKLETETIATVPTNRDRKTVGIGEEIKITFKPTKTVAWAVQGGGAVNPSSGSSTTFTADVDVKTSTITATVEGVGVPVSINSIIPSGATGTKSSSNGGTMGSVGMMIKMTFQPATVSFYKVEFLEVPGPATNVNGYYTQFTAAHIYHNPNPNYLVISQDNTFCCDNASWNGQPAPYSAGHFDWKIPYKFRVVGSTKIHQPFDILQSFDMKNAAGDCSVEKFGLTQP